MVWAAYTVRGSSPHACDEACLTAVVWVVVVARPERSPLVLQAKETADALRSTSLWIEELNRLAHKKGLFDDPTAEINQLSGAVRASLGDQQRRLVALMESLRRTPHGRRHWEVSGMRCSGHSGREVAHAYGAPLLVPSGHTQTHARAHTLIPRRFMIPVVRSRPRS